MLLYKKIYMDDTFNERDNCMPGEPLQLASQAIYILHLQFTFRYLHFVHFSNNTRSIFDKQR